MERERIKERKERQKEGPEGRRGKEIMWRRPLNERSSH